MTFESLLLKFLARQYADANHSIFAPSGSAMWLRCSGSLIPNLLAPDQAGPEAAEGTVAHECGEQWLKTGERPDHRIGEIVQVREGRQTFDIEITKSMLDYVQEYVDWCMYLPGTKFVEQRVYFSKLTPIPKQGGTADHFACQPGVLTITDLKFGEGVQVYAAMYPDDPRSLIEQDGKIVINGNSQAMLYALGVVFKWDWLYDFEKIVIRIAQPRRDHMDEWVTTKQELMRFARYVKRRAAEAWTLNAPLSASEYSCRWCKVKAGCPAYLKIAEDIADECFAELDGEVTSERAQDATDALDTGLLSTSFKQPTFLSTAQLAKVLPLRSAFESWFKSVESELEFRANEGQQVPGHKLVESRTSRVFRDEREAVRRMAEAGVSELSLYKLNFISPAQAEDLLAKLGMKKKDAVEFLLPVVDKPSGKPTLVPESDKRPAFVHPADDVFDDLDDDL